MKIPYLSHRINTEFLRYLDELEASTHSAITATKADSATQKTLFYKVYPLFVLVRCLSNPTYTRDPSREAVLSEIGRSGDKEKFIEAIKYFGKKSEFSNELITGVQRQIFSGYFHEMFSDTLLLLNSFYTNNYRGAMIAIRCMLEDLYRHLFYRDHSQEFWALTSKGCSERDLGVTPVMLREYLKKTSYLALFSALNENFKKKNDEKSSDLFDLNERLYKECSGYVHGSEFVSLNTFQTNTDLVHNQKKATDVVHIAGNFVRLAVAFLVAAHLDHVQSFNEYERSIIFTAFTNNERSAYRVALNI
jgi:hypothetical protein